MAGRTYVRPFAKRFFSGFNEIWYVDTVRSVINELMSYDTIQGQGQGQGHVGGPKVAKMVDFKSLFSAGIDVIKRLMVNYNYLRKCVNFKRSDF